MWSRIVELMLGVWLAASPFIFGRDMAKPACWYVDFTAAVLVVVFSLLSHTERFRHAHLGTMFTGLSLMALGYLAGASSPTPAVQNDIITGLLLAMLAIIPNEASLPPRAWRALENRRR